MTQEAQFAIQLGLGVVVALMGVIMWFARMELARMVTGIATLETHITEMNKEIQELRMESAGYVRSNSFFEGAVRDMAADMKRFGERLPMIESRLAMLERGK